MIEFLYHNGTQKEIVALERKFRTIREGLASFERLCETQFNPLSPRQVIAPAKLHRVTQNDLWTLWKASWSYRTPVYGRINGLVCGLWWKAQLSHFCAFHRMSIITKIRKWIV